MHKNLTKIIFCALIFIVYAAGTYGGEIIFGPSETPQYREEENNSLETECVHLQRRRGPKYDMTQYVDFQSKGTIGIWFKIADNTSEKSPEKPWLNYLLSDVSKDPKKGSFSFALHCYGESISLLVHINSGVKDKTGRRGYFKTDIKKDVWHYLAVTWAQDGEWAIYLDGKLLQRKPYTMAIPIDTAKVMLGASGNEKYTLSINKIIVRQAVMTAEEIAKYYKTVIEKTTTTESNPEDPASN